MQSGGKSTESNLVVFWNVEQFPQISFCLVNDRSELLAAVAELHDTDATALPVQQVLLSCLEHFHRQTGRSSSKIEDPAMRIWLLCLGWHLLQSDLQTESAPILEVFRMQNRAG